MPDYTLEELAPEEGAALTAELQAVLAKYNSEMGVSSHIQLLKRVPKELSVPSPFVLGEENDNGTESPKES